MDADGANKVNLTSGAFFTEIAEVSADGKFVAFRGTRAAPAPGGGFLSGIWVMKAEPVGAGNVPVLVSSNNNYGYNLLASRWPLPRAWRICDRQSGRSRRHGAARA